MGIGAGRKVGESCGAFCQTGQHGVTMGDGLVAGNNERALHATGGSYDLDGHSAAILAKPAVGWDCVRWICANRSLLIAIDTTEMLGLLGLFCAKFADDVDVSPSIFSDGAVMSGGDCPGIDEVRTDAECEGASVEKFCGGSYGDAAGGDHLDLRQRGFERGEIFGAAH